MPSLKKAFENSIVIISLIIIIFNIFIYLAINEKKTSEEEVVSFLMKNPANLENVLSKISSLKEDNNNKKIYTYYNEIKNNPEFFLGNKNGETIIIEFFDYNCGYCKRAMTAVKEVLSNDKNIRIVYREFPILSEGSIFASRAALASRAQNKYKVFHEELMSAQQLNEISVMQIAKRIGLDVEKLLIDMNDPNVFEHIQTSRDLADALQFTGTPSFVIGDRLIGGFIPGDAMMEIIASIRE